MCSHLSIFLLALACAGASSAEEDTSLLPSLFKPSCPSAQEFCKKIPAYLGVEDVLKQLEAQQQKLFQKENNLEKKTGGRNDDDDSWLSRPVVAKIYEEVRELSKRQVASACALFKKGGLAQLLRDCVEALRKRFFEACVAQGKDCSFVMKCLSDEKIGNLTRCQPLMVAILNPLSRERQAIDQSCANGRFEYHQWCMAPRAKLE